MKRPALIVAAATLVAVSLFILTSATGNSDFFARAYPWLLAVNGAIAVALASVVVVQLRRLYRAYRAREFGSRLKYRLLLMFSAMAIVPGILLYAISLHFVVRSIDSWFDVRVDAALAGGVALGQSALDYLVEEVELSAEQIALGLEDGVSPTQLDRLRVQKDIDSVTVLTSAGMVVATAGGSVDSLMPPLPPLAQLRQAVQTGRLTRIESTAEGSLEILVIRSLPARALHDDQYFLALTEAVPATLTEHAETVQDAWQDYQQLSLARDGLSRVYTLTLTLSLLVALLGAVAVAVLLSRRFAAPLLILAEGTRAVAQGDYSERVALPARDELGVLTHQFNEMTRQLKEARARADRSQAESEVTRIYLESVLANLSTGVLAFAEDTTLRAVNRGATEILDDPLEGFEELALADWPRHHAFRDGLLEAITHHDGDWHREIEIARDDATPQTLLLRGTRLPEVSGHGFVVVFDDITRLVKAQRAAAWGEVARRLAHEIKNPLTPIQLSAERLAMKLHDHLGEREQAMLKRATGTIVTQVDAMKNLVNAFRDYARLPSPNLEPVSLNGLIHDVLSLYEAGTAPIRQALAPSLPEIAADPLQIRQIIHNLLQNANDALSEQDNGLITISTRTGRDWVELAVRDNGPGFPPELLARAFEPYFTTKAKGTGLGLAIVKKICDEHGGEVRLSNLDQGGAEVRLHFRIARPN